MFEIAGIAVGLKMLVRRAVVTLPGWKAVILALQAALPDLAIFSISETSRTAGSEGVYTMELAHTPFVR